MDGKLWVQGFESTPGRAVTDELLSGFPALTMYSQQREVKG
jgi:hypothetical protein